MFRDFAKRKFDDYLALVEFPAGRITLSQLRSSTLPPFIISFFDYYVTKKSVPIDKKDFEEILDKAIVFNINYIIKPKNTILKFLFGEVETRPVHFIHDRLRYFQFYGYYISQIEDFITVNSLEMVSVEQIEYLIDDVNKKILEEISSPASDAERMSLVKLLYYFFHDLGDNNPINIKIPQKILSVFFSDKGYTAIKKRVDGFFSDEIFIQEALELMNPETKKSSAPKSDVNVSEDDFKKIVTKAKNESLAAGNAETEPVKKTRGRPKGKSKKTETGEDSTAKDLTPDMFITLSDDAPAEDKPKPKKKLAMDTEFVLKSDAVKKGQAQETALTEDEETPRADVLIVEPVPVLKKEEIPQHESKILEPEEIPGEILAVNVDELRKQEAELPNSGKNKIVISEDIYSDDLIFASRFTDLTPPVQLTDKEIRGRLIEDLFCEASYRKKIIKHIFDKNESGFTAEVNKILDSKNWGEAVAAIEDMFTRLRVDYFSREAVKFVDVMQGHFVKEKYAGITENKAV